MERLADAHCTFCSLVSGQSLLCQGADRLRALQVPRAHESILLFIVFLH